MKKILMCLAVALIGLLAACDQNEMINQAWENDPVNQQVPTYTSQPSCEADFGINSCRMGPDGHSFFVDYLIWSSILGSSRRPVIHTTVYSSPQIVYRNVPSYQSRYAERQSFYQSRLNGQASFRSTPNAPYTPTPGSKPSTSLTSPGYRNFTPSRPSYSPSPYRSGSSSRSFSFSSSRRR